MKFKAEIRSFALQSPFRIATAEFTHTDALIVTVEDGAFIGRGEAEGVFYTGETAETILAQTEAVISAHGDGLDRLSLQDILPPGGARNAIDCALWDLEAKRSGRSIWSLTEVSPRPLATVFTIGIEPEPEAMAERARAARAYPVLKLKLNADRPVERVQLIRQAHPDARMVVDVNEGWDFEMLKAYAPALAKLGIDMIEQPLPRGEDAALEGYRAPVPLCADESCLHRGELDQAKSRYQMINIKLDKTGGLTEALALAHAAKKAELGVMVGNMMGSSLAMAPSFVVGCLSDFVDIDGPLLLREDWTPSLTYQTGMVEPPTPDLWG